MSDLTLSLIVLASVGAGYQDPKPADPEDEKTKLQREFIEAERRISNLVERMESVGLMRVVA